MMDLEELWSMMVDGARPPHDRQFSLMLEVDSMLNSGETARCAEVVSLVLSKEGESGYLDALMGLAAVYGPDRDDGLDDVRARLDAAIEEAGR